jgi:hypothetical protein
MVERNIIIHEKAENSFRKKVAWYYLHCGLQFINTFTNDIWHTYHTLAAAPSIGKVKKTTANRTYAEFVSHAELIVQYWYDDKELHILNLVSTKMKRT